MLVVITAASVLDFCSRSLYSLSLILTLESSPRRLSLTCGGGRGYGAQRGVLKEFAKRRNIFKLSLLKHDLKKILFFFLIFYI